MNKTIVSFVTAWLSLHPIAAQTGFRPAFIIKHNGDTLNGLVQYTKDGKFSKACTFKRFEIAQTIHYSPGQIKAFGFFQGRYFESKSRGNHPEFMECLVKGRISVFAAPGKNQAVVYLETATTGFFELRKGTNRLPGSEPFRDYRKALEYLLNETGSMAIADIQVDYDAWEIAQFVADNESPKQPHKLFEATPPVSLFKDLSLTKRKSALIGLFGGIQYLTVAIPGSVSTLYFDEAEYNSSMRPVFGLFLNKNLLRRSELLSVDLALQFVQDTYYGYSAYEDEEDAYANDIFIEFSALQLPLSLKFRTGKGKVHPFAKVGGYTSFLLDDSFIRNEDVITDGSVVYLNTYADYSLGRESGLAGAAGIDWDIGTSRLITLEAGYQWGQSKLMSVKTRYQTTITSNCFTFLVRINL